MSRFGTAAVAVGFATAALALSCTARTLIHPDPPEQARPQKYVAPGGCNVRDYAAATDLPQGSRNLVWVTVEEQDSDEDTFLLLRQKICELGGNALSQPAWVKGPTDEKPKLTANAWTLP